MIERLRARITGWDPPAKVALLFGSVARGEATPDSDLDLLIVRESGCDPDSDQWRTQLLDLEQSATVWTGNDARVLEYGEEELALVAGEPLFQDALRDCIELCGSRRTLRRLMHTGLGP